MSEAGRREIDKINPFLWMNGSMPWWAKLAVFCAFWLGPSLIFALIFVAIFIGAIPSPITQNREALARIETILTSSISRMAEIVASRDSLQEKLLHVSVETCRNAARTEQQEIRCDYWRR